MLQQVLQDKSISEYLVTGIIGIGFVLIILLKYSSIGSKIKNHFKLKEERKENRQFELMERANKPLQEELEKYKNSQLQFHKIISEKIDTITTKIEKLEQSDQEQLRQLMDKIYDKHINDKTITLHEFERYESLYNNYTAEGGNGKYANRWEDVKTWTKIK